MVKIMLIGLLLIMNISVFCQQINPTNSINQTDNKGRKVGYWEEYHDNGSIRVTGYYKLFKVKLSKEDQFFKGTKDSLELQSFKDSLWKEYDEKGNLVKKEMWSKGFRISNFNFHLSSSELSNDIQHLNEYIISEDTLFFKREFNSSELRFYSYPLQEDYKKAEAILTAPLSIAQNAIFIGNLKNGEYLLRLVDFRNSNDRFIKLIKE